jgi:uncharacterized protein YdeI (BOF family)
MDARVEAGGEPVDDATMLQLQFKIWSKVKRVLNIKEQVTMLADQSGSIVVDIWKDSYANFPAGEQMSSMNRKLEWLKGNMPDGWSMHEAVVTNGGNWIIDCGDNRWTFNDYSGDIGLAPLTALLKQEMLSVHKMLIESSVYTKGDEARWDFQDGIGADFYGYGGTEFEAVFNAYKEMR